MKYSNRFQKMLPDEFTRGMIYKQESRNSLFARKLVNIDKKIDNNANVMESNLKRIYILLLIVAMFQGIQLVQYNSFHISVFRSILYSRFKNISDNYNQIYGIGNSIFNNVYSMFDYGYKMYESTGNYFLNKI